MKAGMNLLLWTGAATEEHIGLIKDIKGWGYDGVEFPMFDHDASPWATLSAACDDQGLGRTAVGCLPEGANLINEDAGQRQAGVDFLKGCVDCCATLGAETLAGPIYSPVGLLVGRGPNDDEFKWAQDGLHTVGEHAAQAGISLSVEALNRFETYFINTQAQVTKLIDAIGLDNVGHMYDTFHANIEEKGIADAIRTGGKNINHVHVSSNDRGAPGEDHIPWGETFAALKEVGYDGWLTVEAFGSWIPELAGATCIWRQMAKSEEHVAQTGLKTIQRW